MEVLMRACAWARVLEEGGPEVRVRDRVRDAMG